MKAARPLFAVVAVVAVLGAAAPPERAFSIGTLRRDGVIIPFATFDGKRWSTRWPGPRIELDDVPVTLGNVPGRWWGTTGALSDWQVWSTGPPRTVHVTQPDWVNVHCQRQVVLRTDYKGAPPTPPQSVQPYPKDGLAVSPPQPVERIEILSPTAPGIRTLTSGVRSAFNKAEREVENRYGHPFGRRARESLEPTIDALYAFGDSPRVFYTEATRSYRHLGDTDCANVAFGTGWFVRDGETTTWLDMAVDLLPCNLYGATYMLPFGAMRIGGRLFWIAQYSGWDHERFVVVEIKGHTAQAVVNAWGGGC